MQRLFSAFPIGLPGVGLLLMRLALAASLFVHDRPEAHSTILLIGSSIGSLLLVAGLGTPIVSILGAVAELLALAMGAAPPAAAVVATTTWTASALLGPGAYSLDALRYGRRTVQLTSSDSSAPPTSS